MPFEQLVKILEAILVTAEKPLSIKQLMGYFNDTDQVNTESVKEALEAVQTACDNRAYELKKLSSGYRLQTRDAYKQWVVRHWEEKPPRYSRAVLETLALIAYRQPITRAEIEDVRGVSVSSHIIKTLREREWIRVLGHKELPGRPAMFGTTRQFLDYFNLSSLNDLPELLALSGDEYTNVNPREQRHDD